MTDATSASTKKTVRVSRTGKVLEVRGFGALRGQFKIAKGVDLTKPIYEQVVKRRKLTVAC